MHRSRPLALTAAIAGALALAISLAGCGHGGNPRDVGLRNIPLPADSQITERVRACDPGANAYCSIQLVVTGSAYGSSWALLESEEQLLRQRHWRIGTGPIGPEHSADSPGHELRLNYATAYGDLLGIDSSWIKRAHRIAHALSATMFNRSPAISIMLVRGSS